MIHGEKKIGGKEKFSYVDLVSDMFHCTNTSAETVEDTAAA